DSLIAAQLLGLHRNSLYRLLRQIGLAHLVGPSQIASPPPEPEEEPDNVALLMKHGLALRDEGNFEAAIGDFTRITEISPEQGEAQREKGMAENKYLMSLAKKRGMKPEHLEAEGIPSGEASLRRAVQLNPEDFDALSSLGGVLKRQNRLEEAYNCYELA